jgi:hypothetical protein
MFALLRIGYGKDALDVDPPGDCDTEPSSHILWSAIQDHLAATLYEHTELTQTVKIVLGRALNRVSGTNRYADSNRKTAETFDAITALLRDSEEGGAQ